MNANTGQSPHAASRVEPPEPAPASRWNDFDEYWVAAVPGLEKRLRPWLFRVLRDESHDILQEAYLRIRARFVYYDPDQPFLAWAWGCVRQIALEHYRRWKQRPESHDMLSEEAAERLLDAQRYGEGDLTDERRDLMAECLGRLTADETEFLVGWFAQRHGARTEYAGTFGLSLEQAYERREQLVRRVVNCVERKSGMKP
jgi:RNA polymerase sigma factor (sigma-70 family)